MKSDENPSMQLPVSHPSVVVDRVHQIYKTEISGREAVKNVSVLSKMRSLVFGQGVRSTVHAVNDVSFVAYTGQAVGILGLNGSGKSTLLRMIAGVESPTKGVVLARSQPTLLGVGAALLPDLTGLRNIRLGCLAMGLSPEETEEATPKIIELAGIEDAVYRPMKTYSSGMAARLRFAINAAARPDILLIDEALGTGDATFKEKSEQVLAEIRQAAGTVFLVSHAAQTIEEMCTRAIWMHKGQLIADGPAYETARQYRLWAWRIAQGEKEQADKMLAEIIESYVPTKIIYREYEHLLRGKTHNTRA